MIKNILEGEAMNERKEINVDRLVQVCFDKLKDKLERFQNE